MSARWPQNVSYNYTTHPEILSAPGVMQLIYIFRIRKCFGGWGLRGLSDVSYASMDPSVRNDNTALGRLISKAIADQIGVVDPAHPMRNSD